MGAWGLTPAGLRQVSGRGFETLFYGAGGYGSPSAVKATVVAVCAVLVVIIFYFMKQDRELSDLLLFISFQCSKY